MKLKKGLLGYYNYTVILTYAGMLAGFFGIVLAVRDCPFGALLCLMISGFCDMFDGAVASTRERTQQEKNFGIQIDSFSDLVCFGVLPAMITCSVSKSVPIVIISGLYVLCALIRLSYFNVDEQERQLTSSEPRELYYGMPVTLSALFVPVVFSVFCLVSKGLDIALAALLIVMAALFLSPIPLKKPRLPGKIGFICIGVLAVVLVVFAHSRI